MCSITDSEAGSAFLATCSYSLCIYRPQVKSQPAPHPLHPTHTTKASYRLAQSCTCCHAPSSWLTFAPRCSGYFPPQFLLSTVGCLPMERVISTPVSTNSANKAGTSWCNPGKCCTKHWCNTLESCDYSPGARGMRMPCLLSSWLLLSPLPASTKPGVTL